jgi:hypothetical protein
VSARHDLETGDSQKNARFSRTKGGRQVKRNTDLRLGRVAN